MANRQSRVMQPEDLRRAVRSVAELFDTDEVIVVGSQALLVARDDVAQELRTSEEFDAYPKNYVEWERLNPGEEASETINALLGEGSQFHETHGFFVDGVDATTAKLAPGWESRAVSRVFQENGNTVKVIAPEPNDLVAAKLTRGDPKDIAFARVCLHQGLVKHDQIKTACRYCSQTSNWRWDYGAWQTPPAGRRRQERKRKEKIRHWLLYAVGMAMSHR